MRIGAQFFTLRDYCRNTEDFAETLKKVADIGYEFVQISGTCAYDPAWLKEELRKNGLRCVLTHTDSNRIKNDTEKVLADHKVFDCRLIGIGCMPGGLKDPSDCDHFIRDFKVASQVIAKNGCYFMYHNHNMEFMRSPRGKLFLEELRDAFLPEELGFTLDTYWAQCGGADPAQWIEKLSGRVPAIHLKDMACVNSQQKMAPVGEGNINFERVLAAAEKAGTEYLLVEQDDCNGENPFDCLTRSYRNLRAMGLD